MSSGLASSANSSVYAMPEQPVVLTPKRRPTPLPRLARNFCTREAAVSVKVIAIIDSIQLQVIDDRGKAVHSLFTIVHALASLFCLRSAMAALMASSARTEQWILTGGSANSSAISEFLIVNA